MPRRYIYEDFTVAVSGGHPQEEIEGTFIMPLSGYANEQTMLVCCYGGSRENSWHYAIPFVNLFTAVGYGVTCFDYRGVGMRGVELENTGLHTRVEDTKRILDFVRKTYNPRTLVVMGFSMGAHVAVRAIEGRQDVGALILSAPAAYTWEVMEQKITFGRWKEDGYLAEGRWKNSEVFNPERQTPVPLLIVRFTEDATVHTLSGDIPWYYFVHNYRDQNYTLVNIPGEHRLFRPACPELREKQLKVFGACEDWMKYLKNEKSKL